MPLKLKLKPGEQVVLGGAVLLNGSTHAEFTLQNKVPVLRGKDLLSEEEAETPCQRIYFLLQLMYIEQRRTDAHYNAYLEQVKGLLQAAPSMVDHLYAISEAVLDDDFYRALRRAKDLIAYEDDVLGQMKAATRSTPETETLSV